MTTQTTLSPPDKKIVDDLNEVAARLLSMDSGSGDARLFSLAANRIRELVQELQDAKQN